MQPLHAEEGAFDEVQGRLGRRAGAVDCALGRAVIGPAHLDLYRKVQAAGKIVHIELCPEDVEPLVRELDPRLLMLSTRCSSIRKGEALLAAAARWMAACQ